MMQLIEEIKLKVDSIPTNTKENRRVKGSYVGCLILAQAKLPIEQQAFEDAFDTDRESYTELTGRDYYNQTYKL
jgi:hypothetical protein